ncbi:MAG: RIP metalloprotease RseP [Paludibacteraceae bacterium]|nr:RIP metalloprotease RseP [Paludibacteraceae bacterium]
MSGVPVQVLQLFLSLTILVVAHEAGHFFFAKLFGVRVERFYMFFNPWLSIVKFKKVNGKWKVKFFSRNTPFNDKPVEELDDNDWRKYPDNTEFGIGWLPLGGYCKIAGMVDESMDTKNLASEPKKWEYRGISTWKRLPIITGGVLVNFILAILIFSGVLFNYGSVDVKLNDFNKGFEFSEIAHEAGFEDGDMLVEADGEPLDDYNTNTIRRVMKAQTVVVKRGEERHTISIPSDFGQKVVASGEQFMNPFLPFVIDSVLPNTPAAQAGLQKNDSLTKANGIATSSYQKIVGIVGENKGKSVTLHFMRDTTLMATVVKPDTLGKIGVTAKGFSEFYTFKRHEYGLAEALSSGATKGVSNLTGYISDFRYIFAEDGMKNLGGFGSISQSFSKIWDWEWFWEMTALLSVILAFMNILPIPGLDGGHLMFLLYEMVTGKKPSQKVLEVSQLIGMILILFLFFYANMNDILR